MNFTSSFIKELFCCLESLEDGGKLVISMADGHQLLIDSPEHEPVILDSPEHEPVIPATDHHDTSAAPQEIVDLVDSPSSSKSDNLLESSELEDEASVIPALPVFTRSTRASTRRKATKKATVELVEESSDEEEILGDFSQKEEVAYPF
jgi:hypothetical protein